MAVSEVVVVSSSICAATANVHERTRLSIKGSTFSSESVSALVIRQSFCSDGQENATYEFFSSLRRILETVVTKAAAR
jgi:hypothetical protein